MDSGEKKNILVVDDDREIVRAIALNLESEGYNVFKAYDGMEALDLAMTKDIHLILIDVMMPKLDGLSAIMKIRERKNLPIIVLSAKSEDSDKVIGLSMGADDYVTKPFNPMELTARVKSQLRRYTSLGDIHSSGENTIVNGRLTFNLDEHVLYADEDRGAADAQPRPHLPGGGDLQQDLERVRLLHGEHGDGAHPPHPGED